MMDKQGIAKELVRLAKDLTAKDFGVDEATVMSAMANAVRKWGGRGKAFGIGYTFDLKMPWGKPLAFGIFQEPRSGDILLEVRNRCDGFAMNWKLDEFIKKYGG